MELEIKQTIQTSIPDIEQRPQLKCIANITRTENNQSVYFKQ